MATTIYPAKNNSEAIELNISNANQFFTVLQGGVDESIPTHEGNGEIPSVAKALSEAAAYKTPLQWETSGEQSDLLQPRVFDGNLYVPLSVPAPFDASPDSQFWRLVNPVNVDVTKDNTSATSDPTVNDDESTGYSKFSRWINTASGEYWVCVDATAGSAQWVKASLTLDELGTAAVKDTGTLGGQVLTNDDLPNSSSVGTASGEIPTNNDLDTRGFAESVDSVATLRTSSFPANLERLWLSGYEGVGTLGAAPLYRGGTGFTASDDNGKTEFVDGDGVKWATNKLTHHTVEDDWLDKADLPPIRSKVDDIDASWGSNATASTYHQVLSYNGNQYLVYWDTSDELVVAKRELPEGEWQTHILTGVTINSYDAHWTANLGIDANGRILIAYNTRNSSILWRYSINTEDITSWSAEQTGMTGANEFSATYPTFVLGPNRKLVFLYRQGGSGNGDLMVNEWDPDAGDLTAGWSALHHPLIEGSTDTPTNSQYWWGPPITSNGKIHLFFCWRETGGAESNFDLSYAYSDDGGVTWKKSDGTPYALPITYDTAEIVDPIPTGSSFLNGGGAAEDSDGNPLAVYHRDDSQGVPQLFMARFSGSTWNIEKVTDRSLDYPIAGTGTLRLPMARPIAVVYPGNRIVIATRDYEYGNALTFYSRQRGYWRRWGPIGENLNGWEPQFDRQRFLDDKVLSLIVTPVADKSLRPQWVYNAPFEVWDYYSPLAIPKQPTPSITSVASVSRGGGNTLVTTSNSFVATAATVTYSRPSFHLMPTHVRVSARVRNNTTSDPVRVRARIEDDLEGISWDLGERSTPDGGMYVMDTGWVEIPAYNTSTGPFFPVSGLASIQIQADGGECEVLTWHLQLGAKV